MNIWPRLFLGSLLGIALAHSALAQQPVVAVSITEIAVRGASGSVVSYTLTNPGRGYVNAPIVTLSGGGGTGATARADLANVVSAISVSSGGAGYTSAPLVTLSGGSGSGATAEATVSGGVVTAITVTSGGDGYTGVPIVTLSGGGATTPAVATASISKQIAQIVRVTAGTGYTSAPTVTITPAAGDPAPAVAATAVAWLGGVFDPPNEASAPAGTTIDISALAVGTFLQESYTYSFFVNGLSIGKSPIPIHPPMVYTIPWTPPQPGSYFITVTATDGVNTATSLPVRFFATGTVVNSPVTGTLVPSGSSVVLKADATVASGFIKAIQFYDNGQPIGPADTTLPYSLIYTPSSAQGTTHSITAVATTNTDVQMAPSPPIALNIVNAIHPLPTCAISSPAHASAVAIPATTEEKIVVAVDANSTTGRISKVELYIDGVLFETKTGFPYTFSWRPTVVGTYNLTALAYDDKNNVVASNTSTASLSTPASTRVTIAAPPTVTIITPTNGSTLTSGSTAQMKATATDSNNVNGDPVTISSVQFFDSGSYVGSATVPSQGSVYSISFPVVQRLDANGEPIASIFTALATSSIGITRVSDPIRVTVTDGGSPPPAPVIGDPPVANVTAPLAAAQLPVNAPASLFVNATDSDGVITYVQFVVNDKVVTTDESYPYSTTWTPAALGNYRIKALVSDNDGNVVTSPTVVVTVKDGSATAPTISISSPAAGATLTSGNPSRIEASAADDVAIASVQFYVNGQPQGAEDSSYPYLVDWTPNSPGNYTLIARATDNVGNQTTSSPVTVTVTSGAAPSVTLTSPSVTSIVSAGMPVNLTATAGDLDGTVASVKFLVNGIVVGTASGVPYTASWKPSAAGFYSLQARATDNAGNITDSSVVLLTVLANQLPLPKLTSPANGATVRAAVGLTLMATATDVDGTISSVEFFANGTSVGTATTPPYRAQWTPAAEGVYRITVTAVDNAGAVGTSTPTLVTASISAADTIATGAYQGGGEAGSFALAAAVGHSAKFIGYSTASQLKKTYFYGDVPIDVSGAFQLENSAGDSLISGYLTDTSASGTLDRGRLIFIGLDTGFFPSSHAIAAGYYSGLLTGRSASSVVAIVGEDGSVTMRVADGAFVDAGGGTAGMVNAAGAFSFTSMNGNRVSGSISSATGVLSGTWGGSGGGAFTATPTALSQGASGKIVGAAKEVGSDIYVARNGRTYDQILLDGRSASITADAGQVTRISYVDLSNDIVQVEFAGAGRLTLTLENATGPASAVSYNQPDVRYMKGHAGIVITGADETTNVSVFSVGTITAANQTLFKSGVPYDGVADIAYIAIMSSNGRFGGVRTANASYLASSGMTGLCAPGVQFDGPVYVGDITASGSASALIVLGGAAEVQITGGDLWQANGQPVQVSGFSRMVFVNGTTSNNVTLLAQNQRSRLEQDGVDVTAELVVKPSL